LKSASATFLLLIAAVAVSQEGAFTTADLSLSLTGFSRAKVEPAGITFSGEGAALKVDAASLGIRLTSHSMEGKAVKSHATYFLESALMTGSAVVEASSKVREDWEIKAGKRKLESPTQSLVRITSERLDYHGSATQGELTIPGQGHIHSESHGTGESVLEIDSASGSLTLDPSATTAVGGLRKGELAGPVHLNLTRTLAGTPSTYTALCDRMNFDFTGKDKAIILTGHVTFTSASTDFSGTAVAQSVTVTVDDQLVPIRYEFLGDPSTTTVKTGGGR
jgi:hypothetical protein